MTDMLSFMAAPFAACLVLVGLHAYFGIHVIERRILFVDLAVAQFAALGAVVGFAFGLHPGEPGSTSIYNAGAAGAKDRFVHGTGVGSNGQTYYYGAFVHRTAAPSLSAGRFCTGRPFDNSGPVKWAFSTGAFSITPPTVGFCSPCCGS